MIPDAAGEAAVDAYLTEYNYSAEEIVQLILEAAAPHLMAEAWEEGRDAEFQRSVMKRQTEPNPYRG